MFAVGAHFVVKLVLDLMVGRRLAAIGRLNIRARRRLCISVRDAHSVHDVLLVLDRGACLWQRRNQLINANAAVGIQHSRNTLLFILAVFCTGLRREDARDLGKDTNAVHTVEARNDV